MNFRVLCLLFLMTLAQGSVLLFGQQETDGTSQSSPDQSSAVLPHWLQFSGELRSRLEGVTGGGFKPNADDVYMLTRVRLGMKIKPTPWLKFMVQGQDARVFWKNQHPAAPPYQDTFDLRQGYVELGDTEKETFGFRAGRQDSPTAMNAWWETQIGPTMPEASTVFAGLSATTAFASMFSRRRWSR